MAAVMPGLDRRGGEPRPVSRSRSSSRPAVDCPQFLTRHRPAAAGGPPIPEVYERKRVLGKGGFAVVFEVVRRSDGTAWACKVVNKASLVKPRAKAKLKTEIEIHEQLIHTHVVRYVDAWDDDQNVYILMELCSGKNLADIVKARGRLDERTAAVYVEQILDAMYFLMKSKVIHRDLKLSNLFLDERGRIKIGDFGLACMLKYDGERKTTICGTPNYIAPEVLAGREGHSYEVDVWSLGVIIYAMLVGRPPFETDDVKRTYRRIRNNAYSFPDTVYVAEDARLLVSSILQQKPWMRPTLADIYNSAWLRRVRGAPPPPGHWSHVQVVPSPARAPAAHAPARHPIEDLLRSPASVRSPLKPIPERQQYGVGRENSAKRNLLGSGLAGPRGAENVAPAASASTQRVERAALTPQSQGTVELRPECRPTTAAERTPQSTFAGLPPAGLPGQVARPASARTPRHGGEAAPGPYAAGVFSQHNSRSASPIRGAPESAAPVQLQQAQKNFDEAFGAVPSARTDATGSRAQVLPSARVESRCHVVSWVDYSSKYGVGYLTSAGGIGVLFNDASRILLLPSRTHLQYIPRRGAAAEDQGVFRVGEALPDDRDLNKKVTLLWHFEKYLLRPDSRGVAYAAQTKGRAGAERVLAGRETASGASSKADAARELQGMAQAKKWLRTKHAMIFRLNNKTIQVEFFDASGLVLASEGGDVTYTDKTGRTQHLRLDRLPEDPHLLKRLRYCKDVLSSLVSAAS
ncbi:unnamed protein product [Pedinophyceae sp. YPF-701]|nr:unnamed protein product [Pedinophyceae sp. YPF-701]